MNVPGIEFLIDRNGRKKAVLIDLKKHTGLWEDQISCWRSIVQRWDTTGLGFVTSPSRLLMCDFSSERAYAENRF